jgi:hypothetical protein
MRKSNRRWTTSTALAIAIVLTSVAIPAVQAQNCTVMHDFTGWQDGGYPEAGLAADGMPNCMPGGHCNAHD